MTVLTLISLFFALPAFSADYLQGNLIKKNNQFYIKHLKGETLIKTNQEILKTLPSLEKPSHMAQSDGRKYSYEFKGELKAHKFYLDEVPTIIAGAESLTGTLSYKSRKFYINGKEVAFGHVKVLNGYSFDDISKESYINKKVYVEGYTNNKGNFIINAIVPAGLFSSKVSQVDPAIRKQLANDGVRDFILETMNKNEYSQSEDPFRLTLFNDSPKSVKPGDNFLVVTLGGRQGDSFGSVNGHFVAGTGVVKDDLSLRGDVSNAYVTNGKDILSGNTSLISYFSHLVQGQNNYRPTYTFIAYGVDESKLKGFRDFLEKSHIRFRTSKLDITPQFNCTTETVKALKSVGVEGIYSELDNDLLGVISSPAVLFGDDGRTLHWSLKNDPSTYQPRPAFDSFAKLFMDRLSRKKLGITRVDYIFYPQTPSNRPVGGTALNKLLKALHYKKLYEKYEVEEKLSPEDLRPLLKELDDIE